MKQSIDLRLLKACKGGGMDSYRDNENYGWLCEEFMEYFAGPVLPAKIRLTYATKNPKEKGFKKIVIRREQGTYRFNVFVSGKFYGLVELFWTVEKRLERHYDNTLWIKIEELV